MRPGILRKQKIVEELINLMRGRRTIAVASIDGVSARLLQKVRKNTSGKAVIKVAKNRLIARALEALKEEDPGITKLVEYMKGPTALVVSDMDPFELFRLLSSEKEYAPLKPGQIAPTDVVIKPGPTAAPAPAIADVKAAGIPARINKGVIEVTEEFVAVKAGEVVSQHTAKALSLLGVKPLELYVKIQAAYSEGIIFPRDVLAIDVEKVREDIIRAHRHALNLAVNAGYPTKESLPILVAKAHTQAVALAVAAGYVTKYTARHIIAKAYAQMLALASRLPPDALDDDLRRKIGAAATATVQQKAEEEEKKKEEEEEKKEEEEAAAGLASLFG